MQYGGVELAEFEVGNSRAGPDRDRQSVCGGRRGIGRGRPKLARPAGSQHHNLGPNRDEFVVSKRDQGPTASVVVSEQVDREAALEKLDILARADSGNQGSFDLGAGCVTSSM